MKKCVIIYNPVSGREKNKEFVEDFYVVLKKYGYDLELIYTKGVGSATKIIKEMKKPELAIVAGGDGTLSEVIRGNLKREDRILVAHLPLGTTNDIGKMYGCSKDYVKNLELILNGVRKKVDVGLLNNHSFIYSATFGNIVDVSYKTSRSLKNKLGQFAYVLSGVKEGVKKLKQYELRYKINGKTYQGKYAFIFITNTNTLAGKKNIYDNIKLDDRLLEVMFIKAKNKLDLIRILYYVFTGKTKNIPNSEFYQTSNLEIFFENDSIPSWCIDGEELKLNTNKVKISVNSDNSLLVPDINIEKLFK